MHKTRSLSGWFTLLFASGCVSTYQPADSPRIATKLDNASLVLVRDGREYPVGFFGTEVVDAVRGNPHAEEHARVFSNRLIGGFSFYVGGLGLTVSGLSLMGAAQPESYGETAGGVLTLAGLGALVTSFVFLMNAQPHLWDAINIYNDGVDAQLRNYYRYGSPPLPPPALPRVGPLPTSPSVPGPAPSTTPAPPVPSATPPSPGPSATPPSVTSASPGPSATPSSVAK